MTCPIPGGFLIAIEGIDGSGKTTQAHMLSQLCAEYNLAFSRSKEPTRGKFGQILRESALTGRLSLGEELDLFLKDRREHVETLINPSLARNEIVILDRYYYSTAAYQGARGADPNEVLRQNREFAPAPDLLILLDVPPEVGRARIRERGDEPNAFEDAASLQRARDIFNSLELDYLKKIDARTGPEIIHFHIKQAFQIVAMNKISRGDMTSSGINRTLEFFGELPIPAHA
jgi:dTMP kinase